MNKKLIASGALVSAVIVPFLSVKLNHAAGTTANDGHVTLSWAEALAASTDKPDAACDATFKAVIDAAPAKGTWAEPVLDHLHDQLYRFNDIETADVEKIFCRLTTVMGVNPNLSSLPQTVTKTDPQGGTVKVEVTAPTEDFATTAGYTAKAAVSRDDAVFMTIWWKGGGTSSKGYLIQGSNPMEVDGEKRIRYVQWDRTSAAQVVKLFAANFATSYLGAAATDRAHFGRVSYNTSSKAITAQSIEIRAGRDSASSFKCVRTQFSGTLGGSITGYRPAQGVEEAVTGINTDGTGMDGKTGVTDSLTAVNGTASPGSALESGSFDWACSDINTAGATGKAFAGNEADMTRAPDTIFPN